MKVWVNGTFDVLHVGHIKLLQFANIFGEVRVGIDSDDRVKKLKGDDRPFNTWIDRAFVMSSIKYVHSVVEFNSDEELIKQIKFWEPDIMVLGSDYKNKQIIGSEFVNEVILFDRLDGYSTSSILNNG